MSLRENSYALMPQLVQWRRHLHQYPELSFRETDTQKYLLEQLFEMGLKPRSIGSTGVVVELGTGRRGVAVRADMDALPLQEEAEVVFKSRRAGAMHACGHDGHMAILLGVAAILAPQESTLPGRVRLMFQPAEEQLPGGAKLLIEDGVLDGVDRVLGLHLASDMSTGTVGVVSGPATANADMFRIEIEGAGGHGSQPERAVDPIVVAAQLVLGLQTIISRNISPRHAAVITVGTLTSGSNFNIIAPRAEMTGTVRSFDEEDRQTIRQRMQELVTQVSSAHRAKGVVTYSEGYPSVMNTPLETDTAERVIGRIVGPGTVDHPEPLMAGEDFSYYLEKRPGVFLFLGCRNPAVGAIYPHHHPAFNLDEEALPIGVSVLATTAIEFLTLKD